MIFIINAFHKESYMKKNVLLVVGLLISGLVNAEAPQSVESVTSLTYVPQEQFDKVLAENVTLKASLEASQAAVESGQQALASAIESGKQALASAVEANKIDVAKAVEAGQSALAEAQAHHATALKGAIQAGAQNAKSALQRGKDSVAWTDLTRKRLGEAKNVAVEAVSTGVAGGRDFLATVYDQAVALPSNIAAGASSAWSAGSERVSNLSEQGTKTLLETWDKGNKEKAAIIVAGAVITAATTYTLYRVATSKKAKKFYSWIGSKFSSKK